MEVMGPLLENSIFLAQMAQEKYWKENSKGLEPSCGKGFREGHIVVEMPEEWKIRFMISMRG